MDTHRIKTFNEILSRVKSSGCLGQSGRQEKLFEFLLKETLAERHKDVTQYGIAVDILDRPESFDATSDSIVRVEMHRLRSNLRKYNSATSEYELSIPRASYEVVIKNNEKANSLSLSNFFSKKVAAATLLGAGLFLAGVFSQNVFNGFKIGDIATLCSTQQPNVFVQFSGSESELQTYLDRAIRSAVAQHTSLNYIEQQIECDSRHAPSYAIDYQVIEGSEQINVSFTTLSLQPNTEVSFSQFSLPLDAPQEDLYFSSIRTVNDLVKPYGVIARKALTKEWGQHRAKSDFKCLVQMYDAFDTDSASDYSNVVECLEDSVSDGIAPLDNYGALAASYLEQVRGKREQTTDNPLEKTSAIFDQIEDDWVNSAELVMAKMTLTMEQDDFYPETLVSIISVAESKYNMHAPVMLTGTIYTGFTLGDWEKAKSMSDKIKRLHSDRDDSVYMIDAPYKLLNETEQNYFQICFKTYSEHIPISNLIVNACAKRFGETEWITKTDENLRAAGILTWEDRKQLTDSLKIEPVLARILINAPDVEASYSSAH